MRRHILQWVAIFALCSFPVLASATESVYTFAVVPQFPASIIQRDWAPLLERVGKIAGVRFQLKLYASISDFEKGVLAGEPDFAYMNPYHAVMARKALGYTPLLREWKRQLVGILVVPKESPVQTVRDLDGKVVAFPSPNALAASLYMRALLAEKEEISITPVYVKTHSNVYRNVLLGKAVAGGGVNKTLKKESQALQAALRILYRTPGIAPHPVCVHPRVPEDLSQRFVSAFQNLAEDESGKVLLGRVSIPHPVTADYQRDYEPLEDLGLENFLSQR
ncbi:MAG: phosphate/phosphite/phosphonate ABC transporter substrate-binding protein [Desulfobulbaceae bacterium]|nr:phosphate/phosphite/phosphonate ABC transporter substrate-binding protein [Desulfobulbaceae bacterium]